MITNDLGLNPALIGDGRGKARGGYPPLGSVANGLLGFPVNKKLFNNVMKTRPLLLC